MKAYLIFLLIILSMFLIPKLHSSEIQNKNLALEKQLASLEKTNNEIDRHKYLKQQILEEQSRNKKLLKSLKSNLNTLNAQKQKYLNIGKQLQVERLNLNKLVSQIEQAKKNADTTNIAEVANINNQVAHFKNSLENYNKKLEANNKIISKYNDEEQQLIKKYNSKKTPIDNPLLSKINYNIIFDPIASLIVLNFKLPYNYSIILSYVLTTALFIFCTYILVPFLYYLYFNKKIEAASDLIELGLAKKVLKEQKNKDGTTTTKISKLILPKIKWLKPNSSLQLTLASTNITEELLKNSLEQLSAYYLKGTYFEEVERVNNNSFILKASTLPSKVPFEECHPSKLKPMHIFAGITSKNVDYIIDTQSTAATYIQGPPGSGKSVLIQSMIESICRSVNHDITIIAATTKPNDFFFLSHLSRYDSVVIDMNTSEGYTQLANEFAEVDKTANKIQEIVNSEKILDPSLHKGETLRQMGHTLPKRRVYILDECADYLKVERADSDEEKEQKLKVIKATKEHIRRTARYCSIPIICAAQVDLESDLDLNMKQFHLRIASNTNSAMSHALTGDSKLLVDKSFTKGKFAVKTETGLKIIKAPLYDPSETPDASPETQKSPLKAQQLANIPELSSEAHESPSEPLQAPAIKSEPHTEYKITNTSKGPTHTSYTVCVGNKQRLVNVKNGSSEKQIAHRIKLQLLKEQKKAA
jgi:hypothetical protein